MSSKKKLSISLEAIKQRVRSISPVDPNLSNSLIDAKDIVQSGMMNDKTSVTVIDNTTNGSPPDTVTTLMKIIPMNSEENIHKSKKSKTHKSNHKLKSNHNTNRLSRTVSPSPSKYLTSINKKHAIQSNNQGKAMSLLSHLFDCKSIHIKIFHISWIVLFISFFYYRSICSLHKQISLDLQLNSMDFTLAMSIQSFSMFIFSILFGDLCDKIGARYSFVFLVIISFFPALFIIFFVSYSKTLFIILSFFIGIMGASFVIIQYHITQFFSSNIVGIANGLSAGWGLFFATFASSNLRIISNKLHNKLNIPIEMSWKYTLLIPYLLLFISAFIYFFNTIDSPKGNISKELVNTRVIFIIPKYKWKRILFDYRIWILSLSYAICFGIEMTTVNYFVNYISYEFNINNVNYINYILILVCIISLFGRGGGGYLSDLLYLKYGIQGRVYCLFFSIIFESLFLLLFSISSFHFGYTVLMFSFFILYVQISEGIVFAIVPNLPHQMFIGLCMGIIAGGGAIGSMIGSFIFLRVPNLPYQTAWIICSIFVFLASFSILFIKFTKDEVQNDLRNTTNDFWTCIDDKFTLKDKDGGQKKAAGFVIH